MNFKRKTLTAAALASVLALTACAGENAEADDVESLSIDYATYNPLSLIIKDQGWLEEELDGEVEWVYSAGSNRANENLRAEAIDVGSTAGSAALLARSTGTPINTISVVGNVEWTALVVPEDSDIESVGISKAVRWPQPAEPTRSSFWSRPWKMPAWTWTMSKYKTSSTQMVTRH